MSFWPNEEHWSVKIPLDTPHPRLDVLADTGVVVLKDADFECPESEYLALEYMDWKSGGDTNFAPLATADGARGGPPGSGLERKDREGVWAGHSTSRRRQPFSG